MASSILLCIVPKDQIFDAPLSLRGPASSYLGTAQRVRLRVQVTIDPHRATAPKVVDDRLLSANDINLGGDMKSEIWVHKK